MSDNSFARVEQWGEVLAKLQNTVAQRQIEVAEEKAREIPTCFKELEQLAASITPEDIGRKLESMLLMCRYNEARADFSLLSCEVNLSPGALEKAFKLRWGGHNRFYLMKDYGFIVIKNSSKIILPNLKMLFQELEIIKLIPQLRLYDKKYTGINLVVTYDTRSPVL